jgi:hypothetical protein
MPSVARGRQRACFGRGPRSALGSCALLFALLGTGGVPGSAAAQAGAVPPETPSHVWLDAGGEPVPFQSDDEILEFLRTATVVGRERIPTGVNRPEQLLLEKDGTRVHAAFRVVDVKKRNATYDRFYFDFRDSYRHECAAYELARWLGLDFVPPAVLRRIEGRDGSVQIWLEDTRDSKGFKPPNARAWAAQVWEKDLFDNLILNVDRNLGNILRDDQYRLWLIDHTRAFQPERQLLNPEALARVKRQVWDRLLATTKKDLKVLLGDYLDGKQIDALARRREALIEHVEGLVADRGEGAVFY